MAQWVMIIILMIRTGEVCGISSRNISRTHKPLEADSSCAETRARRSIRELASQTMTSIAKQAGAIAIVVGGRLGLDSSLFSLERDSRQPEGRKGIAQRFIAGSGQPGAVESRRDDRNPGLRLIRAGILSSLRDFQAADSDPSDKSLYLYNEASPQTDELRTVYENSAHLSIF